MSWNNSLQWCEFDPMPVPSSDLIEEFSGVERVVADPLRFKFKLSIGEDAYASLRATRVLGDVWRVGTGAVAGGATASSSVVASTFFGSWLTALGIAGAATPIGWVLGAAAASGAACYGVMHLFRGYQDKRVAKVPTFINTPIDFLGATLFDLMATLAIRVAQEAGELDQDERQSVRAYFEDEWGLDPNYLDAALPVIELQASDRALEEIATDLARFKLENPDCNFAGMKTELISFLKEISEADGKVDEAEEIAIAHIERVFETVGGKSLTSWTETITSAPGQVFNKLAGALYETSSEQAQPVPLEIPDKELKPEDIPLPVIWLLGKTAAGKTSLIRAMTGASEALVGNGFEPCTRTSLAYDFPKDAPVMRFLDTRGLGEAHYDPTEDLAECQSGAHVLLVLARIDDPVQGVITDTLKSLRKHKADMPIILLHTAGDKIADHEGRNRSRIDNQLAIEQAWGGGIPELDIILSDPQKADLSSLCEKLLDVLPSVALFMERQVAKDVEAEKFLLNRNLVLRFAAGAATTGGVPMVGPASIPAIQIAMLTSLATQYGIEWDRAQLTKFAAALGGGVLGGQALGLLGRQAAMLVPVVGQFVAPVLSASWGFASTFALGRAAAYWMYQTSQGNPIDVDALHQRYAEAFNKTTADADN